MWGSDGKPGEYSKGAYTNLPLLETDQATTMSADEYVGRRSTEDLESSSDAQHTRSSPLGGKHEGAEQSFSRALRLHDAGETTVRGATGGSSWLLGSDRLGRKLSRLGHRSAVELGSDCQREWLFQRLTAEEVPGLLRSLLTGEPDELAAGGASLRDCIEHLGGILEGCHVTSQQIAGNDFARKPGWRELQAILAGRNVESLRWSDIHHAYVALATVLSLAPVSMKAPVRYFKFMHPTCEGCISWENPYMRDGFDLTPVVLQGASLLHVAVDLDALREQRGEDCELCRRVLDAKANVIAPVYYDTQALDDRHFHSQGALGGVGHRWLQASVQALHLAVDRGSSALVKLLLERRSSPEARAVFDMMPDYTPLHLAAVRNSISIAKILLAAGANAAETDLNGTNCFQAIGCCKTPDVHPCNSGLFSEGAIPRPKNCALIPTEAVENVEDGPNFSMTFGKRKAFSRCRSLTPSVDGAKTGFAVFEQCIAFLLRHYDVFGVSLEGELRQAAQQAMGTADVNSTFEQPLPHGRFYKRNKKLLWGCLVHYAVDQALQKQAANEANPEKVVRLVLWASADVHARAHYKAWDVVHTCTAMHMAAAGGSLPILGLLLDAGASVEAMVTSDAKAHYTPLLDAAFEGHHETCRFLLERLANPNVPNRLGKTCLHMAVSGGRPDLTKLLTRYGADTKMRERQFREIALLATSRAKESYSVADMLCLCPSAHDPHASPLYDLAVLARRRNRLAEGVISYLVNDCCAPRSAAAAATTGARAVAQPKLSRSTAQSELEVVSRIERTSCLQRLQRAALEGRCAESDHLSPSDHLASIIKNAPRAGISLMRDVLMVTPDVQDAVHGPLPICANLQVDRESVFCLRRLLGVVEPLRCSYQTDTWAPSGKEQPCWLFDSSKAKPEPEWHHRFAPMYSDDAADCEKGDHMVQVKVILLANVLDVKILQAIASTPKSQLDIFAEMPVQAIVSYIYNNFVVNILLFEKLIQFTLMAAIVAWACADNSIVDRLCWTWCAAVSLQEIIVFVWSLRRHLKLGWTWRTYFGSFHNVFEPVVSGSLWALVAVTADFAHSQAQLHRQEQDGYARALLGTTLILRSLKAIMLFRFTALGGMGILTLVYSLHGALTMFTIILSFFATFSTAFVIMRPGQHWTDMQVTVYRGLVLGDGKGLDVMEGVWGRELGNWLMVAGTSFFTVYLLNILIAVLTAEYHKADRRAPLLKERERAIRCVQALLGPVWPWNSTDSFTGAPLCQETPLHTALMRWLAWTTRCISCLTCGSWNPHDDASDAKYVGVVFNIFWMAHILASVLFFFFHPKAYPSAVTLAGALVSFHAWLMRSCFWSARLQGKRYYLWVCHRADYSSLTFTDGDDTEQEQIDDMKRKMERMDLMLQEMHRKLCS